MVERQIVVKRDVRAAERGETRVSSIILLASRAANSMFC